MWAYVQSWAMELLLAAMELLLACAAVAEPAAPPAGQLTAVYLVSRAGPSGGVDDQPKHVRADEGATLYAVLVVDGDEWYSDAGTVVVAGHRHDTRPLAEADATRLRWYKVEPSVEDLSNEASGKFRFEAIPYGRTATGGGAGTLAADVTPTLTSDHGGGAGTMRYQLEVERGDVTLATPGLEARRGRGAGGLSDGVHRVSIRRDDTYLGWLTELYGQPYIWASAGRTAHTHQSERLEGADCADFVTYGWRRLGHDVPYTWTGGLPALTRQLAAGRAGDDGIYRDAAGKAIAFTRPGDLLLFPRHVGVLVADAGEPGVLDVHDVMAHALFASPREVPIADSGYGDRALELRRWK